jgi:hypothetical protein
MGNGQGKPVDLNGEGTSNDSTATFVFILAFICFLKFAIGLSRFLPPCMLSATSKPHFTWHHPVSHVYRAYNPTAVLRSIACFFNNPIVQFPVTHRNKVTSTFR